MFIYGKSSTPFMAGIDWYMEFVDLEHTPDKDDVIVLFHFEPADGMDPKEAVGRIASESSTGTWTTLAEYPARMDSLKAKAFWMDRGLVKVAYPLDL